MADSLKPQPAPCPESAGTCRPGRIVSMSAADRYDPTDPDAITVANSWRHSYKSTEPLHGSVRIDQKEDATEQCDASVTQGQSEHITVKRTEPPTGADSPGYIRMEILASHILPSEKIIIFVFIMVLATAHSLDNFLRVLYQFDVGWYFDSTGLLAAVNTISTLSTATLTPIISKSADVFGRAETLLASVMAYVLGTALQANARTIGLFSTGTVFWTIGFLGVISTFEIIIADITSMRLRVIMFYLPAIPYLATTWISVPLRNALVSSIPQWEKRFAWSAIVYSVCALPLILGMFTIERRAKKRMPQPEPKNPTSPKRKSFRRCMIRTLLRLRLRLRQMDVLGYILFVGFVSCVLAPWSAVPVVAPHRKGLWTRPAMIAVFSTGLLCALLLYYVEKCSKYPMFPAKLLGEKRVLTALAMGFLYHLAYYAQHTYLYIGLIVRHGESKDAAARTVGLYTFTSTLFGIFMGVIISINRDVRWYLRFGAILFLASFILQMIRPAGVDNRNRLAVTCSQLILGIAGGLFPFPAMAFVQAAREHTQLSTLIGAYMTACRLGGGIGQALVGAIWTNVLQLSLHRTLDALEGFETPAQLIYKIPENVDDLYPWDSPGRALIVGVFVESHRYLCAVGIITSTLLILLAFLIQDAPLDGPQQSEGTDLSLPTGDNIELKDGVKARVTTSPLRPSRHPILF